MASYRPVGSIISRQTTRGVFIAILGIFCFALLGNLTTYEHRYRVAFINTAPDEVAASDALTRAFRDQGIW